MPAASCAPLTNHLQTDTPSAVPRRQRKNPQKCESQPGGGEEEDDGGGGEGGEADEVDLGADGGDHMQGEVGEAQVADDL